MRKRKEDKRKESSFNVSYRTSRVYPEAVHTAAVSDEK